MMSEMRGELPPGMAEALSEASKIGKESFGIEMSDDILTIVEAAEKVGVSTVSMRAWIQAGLIPVKVFAGRKYVKKYVAEIVSDLISVHGKTWKKHVVSNLTLKSELDSQAGDTTEEVLVCLAERLKKRVFELREIGKTESALELAAVILEHFSFEEQT